MATAIYVPCLAIDAATGSRLDLRLMILVLGVLVTAYHARRDSGGHLERRDPVLHHVRRPRRDGVDRADARARRPGRIATAARDAGKTVAAACGRRGTGSSIGCGCSFCSPINAASRSCARWSWARMASYTSDQVMVQRFQTTRSTADARRAYVINAAGDVLWMFGLSFVGLALLAYFKHHTLPPEFATDKILPYFMSQAFPPGTVGLVIAVDSRVPRCRASTAINSCLDRDGRSVQPFDRQALRQDDVG